MAFVHDITKNWSGPKVNVT